MSKVLFILGAGPNIGSHVAKAFASKGYKVASASRSETPKWEGADLHVPLDLAKPEDVPAAFETVRKQLGEPGVVIYNAATVVPDPSPDVLSLFTPASIPGYQTSQNINGISALVAMHEATKAFRNLTSDASKTFIFTGNKLNIITLKGMLNFGLGKTTTSYTIKYIVEQGIYKEEGVKFYFADERNSAGAPVGNAVSGPAAADAYVDLAELKGQGPWLYTFVHGKGYQEFESKL